MEWLVCLSLVQSLNSLFLPPPIGAESRPGRGGGGGGKDKKRVQGNLHTHAQNEPIKNGGPNRAARVNLSRNSFFSERSEKKKKKIDVDIVVKNINRKSPNMVYRGLYSYRQRVRVITLYPSIFFVSSVSEFAKVFERKV